MNQIEAFLENSIDYLQKLEGAPAIVLVALCGIVLGYVLKRFKRFPNDGIPVAVILFGGVLYPLIADANNDLTLRVWLVRNVIIGLIINFVAWIFHNKLLKRFLDPLIIASDSPKDDVLADTPVTPEPPK